jgi:hypothetical protein
MNDALRGRTETLETPARAGLKQNACVERITVASPAKINTRRKRAARQIKLKDSLTDQRPSPHLSPRQASTPSLTMIDNMTRDDSIEHKRTGAGHDQPLASLDHLRKRTL